MSGSDFDRRVLSLAKKHRLPQETALLLVNELLRRIAEAAAIAPVRTPLGTFRTATTKPRRIRSPVTGVMLDLPRTYRLAFRAAKSQRGQTND